MKLRAYLAGATAVAAFVAISSPSYALPTTFTQGSGLSGASTPTVILDTDENGSFSDPVDTSFSGYFGSFNMTVGSNTFTSFCLDLLDHINYSGTFDYVPTNFPFDDDPLGAGGSDPALVKSQIVEFFNVNYNSVSSNIEFAAAQLALWEIVYDGLIVKDPTPPNDYFGTGWLQVESTVNTTALAVIAKAEDYLDALLGAVSIPDIYDVTFMDSVLPNDAQDQVIVQNNNNAIDVIPLPAAGWLLASGLLGFFGLGRLRRSGAAA